VLAEAPRGPGTGSFIVLEGEYVDWCFDVTHVREIVFESEWIEGAPIDLPAWWGHAELPDDAAPRLLILQTHAGMRAVRSRRFSQRALVPEDIIPIPWFVARGSAARLISGIVFSESHKPLIVLNAEAVAEMDPIDVSARPAT
jgi:hypothetical protein